jgi:uncharacterized protein YukE
MTVSPSRQLNDPPRCVGCEGSGTARVVSLSELLKENRALKTQARVLKGTVADLRKRAADLEGNIKGQARKAFTKDMGEALVEFLDEVKREDDLVERLRERVGILGAEPKTWQRIGDILTQALEAGESVEHIRETLRLAVDARRETGSLRGVK